MTENKRFSVKDKWIKDNCIGKLLNIDFNTIIDANLCCDLLNQIEDEKKQNGKIASKFLEENEQLYELIDFANTLIAFKTSESCQKEWAKRLKGLKGE